MPKLTTGKYMVLLYDGYGTKQHRKICDSFTDGMKYGREQLGEGRAASFTIDRRVYNSIDQEEAKRCGK